MKVTTCNTNTTDGIRYGLKHVSTGDLCRMGFKWKTKRGAENYAKRNGWEIVEDANESDGIATKYGTITESREDFGYGQVWAERGEIVYQDACGYKSWKTVKGFERWADKQNTINGGVYQTIGASNEPTYEEDTKKEDTDSTDSMSREDITLAVIDQVITLVEDNKAIKNDPANAAKTFSSGVFCDWVNNLISSVFTDMAWCYAEDDLTTHEQEIMFWVVYHNVIDYCKTKEAEEPKATEEVTTVNGNVVTVIEDGRVFEYIIKRSPSGNWFEYMYMDGKYCGDWSGKRCIYGVKTNAPWIRDPYRLGGKIYLTPEMIQALRNAQAAA